MTSHAPRAPPDRGAASPRAGGPVFDSREQPANSARFTFLDPAAVDAAHNVRYHQTGVKRLHHPIVGELELAYEVMDIAAEESAST